ncbi:MAG: hypothetical protein GF355_17275 [Candidatus Eisenbacteria bacterium]|nr:hypothetical protein [Candidatus Eisenbacteria bacterium]
MSPADRERRPSDPSGLPDPAPLASPRNPRVVQLRKWIARPERARRAGRLIVEGRHAAAEALAAGCRLHLFVRCPGIQRPAEEAQLEARLSRAADEQIRVKKPLMESLTGDPSPSSWLTVWERPAAPDYPPHPEEATSLLLGLVGVQDPGNTGSLIRSAAALGAAGVVVYPGTADPYHPKVIRAASGGVFRMPLYAAPAGRAHRRLLDQLERAGWTTVALAPRLEDEGAPPAPTERPRVLLLGSEGQGLPHEIVTHCSERWSLPMAAGIESLGVAAAGAIALYALRHGVRSAARGGASS